MDICNPGGIMRPMVLVIVACLLALAPIAQIAAAPNAAAQDGPPPRGDAPPPPPGQDQTENAPADAAPAQPIAEACFQAQETTDAAEAVKLWTACLDAGEDAEKDGAKDNELDPTVRGVAYYNRGLAYMELDQPDRAIADYSEAAKDLRTDPDVYINRGYAYLQTKNYETAHSDFSRAIALDPSSAEAYTNRAATNSYQGKEPDAVYDLEQALKKDPAYLPALFGLGTLLAMSDSKEVRDGRRAVEVALRLVSLQRDAESLEILAAAHAQARHFAKAVKVQKEAIALAERDGASTALLRDNLERYKSKKKYR